VGTYTLGTLTTVPASAAPELVAPQVLAALTSVGLADLVGVVEIDPTLSDTAATEAAYGLEAHTLANCVIVTGKREGVERIAACVVPSTTRADINNLVKRRLDVRKASFMPREEAVELTGMEFGAITPIGLPEGWPIYVDAAISSTALLIVGSGIRKSKLLVPGELFARLPGVEIVEELGRPTTVAQLPA
jgi:prolyl-tRNA editing enzyme YbaK/EbsC (Cys-tRNA(Pro) deacylase)